MIINTIKVLECAPQTIVIGRRGTYDTMQIAFDLSYLVESFGNGVAVLAVKRSQDESAYPAVTSQEDNTLTWTVSETDTAYVGAGECQLMWYVDGGLAKTIIYPMVVMRDILSTAEEPPDAYQTWVDDLIAKGEETLHNAQAAAQSASEAEQAKDDAVDAKEASEESARKAAAASVHAPIIQNGYWYIWNDGQYVDTGVRAEGQNGDKGDTGEKGDTGNGIESITKTGTSGLVDTYTVTYTNGTPTTFTVTNGAKGDKGDTGATGNGIQSITKTGTSGNVDTYTITYTSGQPTTFTVTNGAVTSVAGKTGAVALNAGDIEYDSTETYTSGTAGAEVTNLNRQISDSTTGLDSKAPVILETVSGAIASFSDGADGMPIKSLVAQIEPVQDLHGYDNPWPAGGNVNKLPPAASFETITFGNSKITPYPDGHYHLSRTAGSDSDTININLATPVTVTTNQYINYISNANTGSMVANLVGDSGTVNSGYWGKPSANIANSGTATRWQFYFTAGVAGEYDLWPIVSDAPVTEFTPYENSCPISGHTGAEIQQRGGNLLKPTEYGGVFYAAQVGRSLAEVMAITATPIDDGYSVIIPTSWHGKIFATDVLPAGNYNAHVKTDVSNTRFAMYITDANYVVTSEVGRISQSGTVDKQITLTEKGRIVFFIGADSALTINVHDLQVESGSSFTSYHPYTGNQISVTFPSTIYGGEDEVISGKLKSTMGKIVFDGTQSILATNWQPKENSVAWCYYYDLTNHVFPTTLADAPTFLASSCPVVSTGEAIIGYHPQLLEVSCYNTSSSIGVIFRTTDMTLTTASAINAYLAENPVTLVYKLATPPTFTHDPQQIDTLYGQNNIWTDVGPVSVEYCADTKLYIDGKLAELQATILENIGG